MQLWKSHKLSLFKIPLYWVIYFSSISVYYQYLILSYEMNIKEKLGQMIIYMWNIMNYFTEDCIVVKNMCVCVEDKPR